MVAYWKLKYAFKDLAPEQRQAAKERAIDGISRIRSKSSTLIPDRTTKSTIILGTWNIRNFDDNRFGHGSRLEESFFYIAEILSLFDIIAVQEICDDLGPFERLVDMLGPQFDFIITDVTEGPGGNRERLGFVFDKNKVNFKGVAGEIVLPFEDQISDVTKQRQFSRTPFSCTFQSGWFNFNFSTVHIYFGKDAVKSSEYERRVTEIDKVAKFISERAKNDLRYNHILVGDFNIEDFNSKTYDALEKNGFVIFKNKVGSNSKQNKYYDQISFFPKKNEILLANPDSGKAHGVFNFFDCVFRDEDFEIHDFELKNIIAKRLLDVRNALDNVRKGDSKTESARKRRESKIAELVGAIEKDEAYLSNVELRKKYYIDEWRTYQISDHFPLFVELKIDFADNYLQNLKKQVLVD